MNQRQGRAARQLRLIILGRIGWAILEVAQRRLKVTPKVRYGQSRRFVPPLTASDFPQLRTSHIGITTSE